MSWFGSRVLGLRLCLCLFASCSLRLPGLSGSHASSVPCHGPWVLRAEVVGLQGSRSLGF
jgi:hypothetical protein